MKLLDFVAIYGFLLMPMGAVIFIDFYVLKKFGLSDFYAEKADIKMNWAAAGAWIITLLVGLLMNIFLGIEVFFLGLPGWFVASAIYIAGSKMYQSKVKLNAIPS
jgi:purine-cytosine permease-like protein